VLERGWNRVAVIGVHAGARSVVDSLEAMGVPCRVLDRSSLTARGLEGLEAMVMPGGWSLFQKAAAGERGIAAVREDQAFWRTRKGRKFLAAYTEPRAVQKHLHNHPDYEYEP